jgi:hypothetical protein
LELWLNHPSQISHHPTLPFFLNRTIPKRLFYSKKQPIASQARRPCLPYPQITLSLPPIMIMIIIYPMGSPITSSLRPTSTIILSALILLQLRV